MLERLPHEALVDLAERLIGRLDAAKPDCNLELDEDACDAGECSGLVMRRDGHPGDADDAEPEDDDAEEQPLPPGKLRPERDGFVLVWRRRPVQVGIIEGRP